MVRVILIVFYLVLNFLISVVVFVVVVVFLDFLVLTFPEKEDYEGSANVPSLDRFPALPQAGFFTLSIRLSIRTTLSPGGETTMWRSAPPPVKHRKLAGGQRATGTFREWIRFCSQVHFPLPPPRALRSTCVLQTDQPKLEEKGPFGYIKRTTKYDVRFSDDGSEQVTYRSWTLYDPVRWCERNGLLG